MANNSVWELFDRVYVINMASREDRWEHIIKELPRVGINNFIRKEGVIVNNGETLRDREKGCFLSHMEIIEEAKALNLNRIFITEDDTVFEDSWLETFEKALGFIKEVPWWIFYFCANLNNKKDNPMAGEAVMNVTYCFATSAYAVSRQGFDKILELKSNVYAVAFDIALTMQQIHGSCFAITPRICYQLEGYSNILNEHRNYDCILRDKPEGNK